MKFDGWRFGISKVPTIFFEANYIKKKKKLYSDKQKLAILDSPVIRRGYRL